MRDRFLIDEPRCLVRSLVSKRSLTMTWTTPAITEICVGMEITAYEAAEI